MGKKYLLEIEENKDGGFAWSNFVPYAAPDLEQVRKEAYQQGYEQGYKDGYNEPGKGKIQVGDEIETPSGLKGYVVNFTDDELVHYVSSEGRFGTMGMSAVSKTGRHFPEIATVLEKMRGEQDG